jgi:hypothetical protein
MADICDKDEFIVRNKDDFAKVVQRMVDLRDGNDLANPGIFSEREKKDQQKKQTELKTETTQKINEQAVYEKYRYQNLHINKGK